MLAANQTLVPADEWPPIAHQTAIRDSATAPRVSVPRERTGTRWTLTGRPGAETRKIDRRRRAILQSTRCRIAAECPQRSRRLTNEARQPFQQSANRRSGGYLLGSPGLQVIDCFKCLTRRAGSSNVTTTRAVSVTSKSSRALAPIWRPRTGMQTRSPACARPRALVLGCMTRASRLRLGGRYWQHPGRSRPQMVLTTAVRAKIIRAQQWLLRYDCMSTQTEVSG